MCFSVNYFILWCVLHVSDIVLSEMLGVDAHINKKKF